VGKGRVERSFRFVVAGDASAPARMTRFRDSQQEKVALSAGGKPNESFLRIVGNT
jgi:hypothetical protein